MYLAVRKAEAESSSIMTSSLCPNSMPFNGKLVIPINAIVFLSMSTDHCTRPSERESRRQRLYSLPANVSPIDDARKNFETISIVSEGFPDYGSFRIMQSICTFPQRWVTTRLNYKISGSFLSGFAQCQTAILQTVRRKSSVNSPNTRSCSQM